MTRWQDPSWGLGLAKANIETELEQTFDTVDLAKVEFESERDCICESDNDKCLISNAVGVEVWLTDFTVDGEQCLVKKDNVQVSDIVQECLGPNSSDENCIYESEKCHDALGVEEVGRLKSFEDV